MAGPTKLQLRMLYTINSSPQYILARSSFLIPVTPIPEPPPEEKAHATQPKYATVALRACLDTICRSSPELIQDNNRDYSVYVLDPLESNSAPAPVNISSSNKGIKSAEKSKEHHYGVAVGLGLMSWALHENDGVVVTGTRVKMNTGQEALEVIFALRETAAMQRTSLSSTMKSWGVPLMGMSSNSTHSQVSEPPSTVDPNMLSLPAAPYANSGPMSTSQSRRQSGATSEASTTVQTRHKAGQKRKVSKPSTALTESDKIMYASETYIGPLKRKGRPRNSNSNGKPPKKSATEENMGVSAAPQLNNFVHPAQEGSTSNTTMTSTPLRFLTSTLPSSDPSQSAQGQASLLDLLTAISNGQNAHLLAALSTIDSAGTNQQQSSEPNPALVSAIGQLLLTACAKQSPNPNVQPSSDFNPSRDAATSTSQDEDVVILDKENINPMAFRRREEREFPETKGNKSIITNDTSLEHHFTHNVLGSRSDGQENSASANTMKRKRTLSDFMDEKESERSKQKEKERSERREQVRHSTQRRSSGSSSIYDTGLRHYPRLATEALPMPGTNYYTRKPYDFRSSPPRPKVDSSNMSSNLRRSITLPSYSKSKAPASSPPRPSAGCPTRKRYVVPEWARTNTATQPRLSEEAQRALAEAEEMKKKEREERRVGKRLRQESRASRAEQKAKQFCPPPSDAAAAAESDTPVTVAESHSCPVFATTGVVTDIFSSLSQVSQLSPPRSPPSSCLASNIPQTPPPKCGSALFTPDNRDNASASLFTPTPRGRSGWPSGSAGSTLFTPRKQLPPSPSPSTTRGKSNNMSPIQAVISGGSIDGASRWNGATEEDELRWDEPDEPPSSLPTASDVEDEPLTSSTFEFETNDVESGDADDEDEQEYTVKQHWPGLPPSSPPPSSPSLAPQVPDDDDVVELGELPVLTSDIDESTSASYHDIQELSNDDDETIKDEFDSFMSSLTSDGSLPSDIDIFNNLSTDIPEQKNGDNPFSMLDSSLDPLLQNGVVDFDFTEFWESFKPMVQDFVASNNAPSSDKADPSIPQNVDHTKLAEDVHALLSGCLM